MEHIVLLGDSIFDNTPYVRTGQEVSSHLIDIIPEDWQVSLCARDGDKTADIVDQLGRVPSQATYLFVSVGGNDALEYMDLLTGNDQPGPLILGAFARIAAEFKDRYRSALEKVKQLKRHTFVCTIYNGDLDPEVASAAISAVSIFNDQIYSTANELKLPVVELRSICPNPDDYVNSIEPSETGGKKIAEILYKRVLERQNAIKKGEGTWKLR